MRLVWKLFLVTCLCSIAPLAFSGCGPSYISEEAASETEQPDDASEFESPENYGDAAGPG